jgi:hypothetical protein
MQTMFIPLYVRMICSTSISFGLFGGTSTALDPTKKNYQTVFKKIIEYSAMGALVGASVPILVPLSLYRRQQLTKDVTANN